MTIHSFITDKCIHQCVLECVAHMQAASDIGWRNHNTIRVTLTGWTEVTRLLPMLVQTLLDILWGIGFIHNVLQCLGKRLSVDTRPSPSIGSKAFTRKFFFVVLQRNKVNNSLYTAHKRRTVIG